MEARNGAGGEMENRPRGAGGRITAYGGQREKNVRIILALQKEIRVSDMDFFLFFIVAC